MKKNKFAASILVFGSVMLTMLLAVVLGVLVQKRFSDVKPISDDFELVQTYPHSKDNFTQGLYFDGDTLMESTGQYGESKLVKYTDLSNGTTETVYEFPKKYFGEGASKLGDKTYLLTWREGKVIALDNDGTANEKDHEMQEGWGLTTDGEKFFATDGSQYIYEFDQDFNKLDTVLMVTYGGYAVSNLNELEYVRRAEGDVIIANVWKEKTIFFIDPTSGIARDVYELEDIVKGEPNATDAENVLNGVAVKDGHLFVTGKRWSKIYEFKPKRAGILD